MVRSLLMGLFVFTISVVVVGCDANSPIRIEEFGVYTPDLDSELAASYPKLRRKVRVLRFAFCEEGHPYTRFTAREGRRRDRPHYRHRRGWRQEHRDEDLSQERWAYLCGFNLLRNRDQVPIWLEEVKIQYLQDDRDYERWIYFLNYNDRRLHALNDYWCGGNNLSGRIAFLEELKNRLVREFPNEYLGYNRTIGRAKDNLRDFCRGRINNRQDAVEISRRWNTVLYEIFQLPT